MLSLMQGFVAWQHLVSCGTWAAFWADPFHKAARKTSAAFQKQDGGADFMRRLMKLFRFTQGPFKSSKFGKLKAESRDDLLQLLQKNPDHPILDTWVSGMARDGEGPFQAASCPQAAFDRTAAVESLRAQQGSWFPGLHTLPAFIGNFQGCWTKNVILFLPLPQVIRQAARARQLCEGQSLVCLVGQWGGLGQAVARALSLSRLQLLEGRSRSLELATCQRLFF